MHLPQHLHRTVRFEPLWTVISLFSSSSPAAIMSRQLISSEKFPTKPHNCPATKVPGLVFCAGQTATGEIKQATVSTNVSRSEALEYTDTWSREKSYRIWRKYSSFLVRRLSKLSSTMSTSQTWETSLQWTKCTSSSCHSLCLLDPAYRHYLPVMELSSRLSALRRRKIVRGRVREQQYWACLRTEGLWLWNQQFRLLIRCNMERDLSLTELTTIMESVGLFIVTLGLSDRAIRCACGIAWRRYEGHVL